MLKKTMTYMDYDGNERTEDFYFNFNKAEIAQMELGVTGGLSEKLKRIVATKDIPKVVEMLKEIVLKSYGEKSPDGKRFIKSQELSEAFSQTEAFSDLYLELATNEDAAAAFINAIIPKVPQDHKKPQTQ